MKTKNINKKKNSGLQNRPEQLSKQEGNRNQFKDYLPPFNFGEREVNRNLEAGQIMACLKRWMPIQHKLAIVKGNLISIQFPDAPIRRVRRELSELGFSWNEKRMSWQHYGRTNRNA